MNRQQALTIVCREVADSLGLDEADVNPEARLVDELGADSLDFIDLIFSLEKRFDVRIRDGELDFLKRLNIADPGALSGARMSKEDVDALRPWLPGIDRLPNLDAITPVQLFSLVTVETLWLLVKAKLESHE